MDLEQEYESKSTALDITLRAFSRGIINERESRKVLEPIIVVGEILNNHLLREQLGLIRRLSIAQPQETIPGIQVVEE